VKPYGQRPQREDMRDRDLERRVRSIEQRMGNEIPVDPLPGLPLARDVQAALAQLAAKIDPSLFIDAADDAAAAALGVEVGQFYRDGSVLMVRVA
jgi:hypothetical protein